MKAYFSSNFSINWWK